MVSESSHPKSGYARTVNCADTGNSAAPTAKCGLTWMHAELVDAVVA